MGESSVARFSSMGLLLLLAGCGGDKTIEGTWVLSFFPGRLVLPYSSTLTVAGDRASLEDTYSGCKVTLSAMTLRPNEAQDAWSSVSSSATVQCQPNPCTASLDSTKIGQCPSAFSNSTLPPYTFKLSDSDPDLLGVNLPLLPTIPTVTYKKTR
jgi:hypothetical protein